MLLRDPVTTADGQTYERKHITKWLKRHTTSPLTGAELASLRSLVANAADPNNSVFALHFKRGRDALAELALLPAPAGDADAAALLRAKGFAGFESDLGEAGAALRKLVAYNLEVSAPVYNRIVQAELATIPET